MNNKNGISLIVLTVSIAVILIISGTVILNFGSFDNRITDAQKAKIKSDIITFVDDLDMHLSASPRENLSTINATKEDILTYIPSMKKQKTALGKLYSDVLIINGGKLKVIEGKLSEEEENIVKEIIESYSE